MSQLKTTPVTLFAATLSGGEYNGTLIGQVTYSGGTHSDNVIAFAIPDGLTAGDSYSITGIVVGTTQHVVIPDAVFSHYLGGPVVGQFTATGWQDA